MKRPAIAGSQTQDTSVSALPLSHDSRITTNPHIYCICTAQVVLNASVAHPVATQHVQYIQKIVGVSGCLALMAQWQSTGGSSQVLGLTPSDCFCLNSFISSVKQDALNS